jgi:hypothetical protein
MYSTEKSCSIIPSLIHPTDHRRIPSSLLIIFGWIIPGVSITYVKGSDDTLKPEIDRVIQGTAPTLAPLLRLWFMDSSFERRTLIIVLLPTFGTPPIMIQFPMVLNLRFILLM